MSIQENVGELEGVVDTLDHAIQQVGESQQFATDAIAGVQGVAGGSAPQSLQEAMQMTSEGVHLLEQAVAQFNASQEKVKEYIAAIQA